MQIISLILQRLPLRFRVELVALFLMVGACVVAQDAVIPKVTPGLPPLESKERMQEYLKALVSPSALYANVLIAGYDEARNFPHEWGRTGTAFGKRLGSQYAQFFLDNTIELGVSAVLKEDNRYVRMGDGSFIRRFGNVARSMVVVSSTEGGKTLALGQIAGAYGSWAIASQVWEPPSEQRVSRILLWGSVNLAAKGGWNLLKEFSPDMKKKHATSFVPPSPPSHP
jgi:hypothetical protein